MDDKWMLKGEKRTITLPKGGLLEVCVTPEFLNKARKQFGLAENETVTDDHVRMFFYGSVKNAVDKAE